MEAPRFTTVITPEYAARRDALAATNPAAHGFLTHLESLGEGYHLGTAQNVHVYDGERFLLYVRIERNGAGRPSLALSSTPHQGQVKSGTHARDASLILRRLVLAVMDLKGFHAWAEKVGDDLVLAPDAPSAFYDRALVTLRSREPQIT